MRLSPSLRFILTLLINRERCVRTARGMGRPANVERCVLLSSIAVTILCTLERLKCAHTSRRTTMFLKYCAFGQAAMVLGLASRNEKLCKVGHFVFTSAVVCGPFFLPARSFEFYLVVALSAFTLATRFLFEGCMLSRARGEDAVTTPLADVLYATPVAVAVCRLSTVVGRRRDDRESRERLRA